MQKLICSQMCKRKRGEYSPLHSVHRQLFWQISLQSAGPYQTQAWHQWHNCFMWQNDTLVVIYFDQYKWKLASYIANVSDEQIFIECSLTQILIIMWTIIRQTFCDYRRNITYCSTLWKPGCTVKGNLPFYHQFVAYTWVMYSSYFGPGRLR